jgi:hypothetical protein
MDKFVCKDCSHIFETPFQWEEKHGLDTPPYEPMSGCPICLSSYTVARQCDCCGDYITGNYIKIKDGARYCEDCYFTMELGDED